MIPSCPTLGWWVVCLILPVCLFVVRVAVALASSASPSAHDITPSTLRGSSLRFCGFVNRTSPVRFLGAVCVWFRPRDCASHKKRTQNRTQEALLGCGFASAFCARRSLVVETRRKPHPRSGLG